MVNESQSPLIVKDVTLMSPGNWNGWNYSAEEIRKAFASKDYNTDEINLFLDHPENPNNAASAWAGRVKNIRQMSDSTLKGDLEIFNQDVIYNLKIAKAKFGVSPRIIGKENKQDMSFTDMIFDNWSIVSKPAQSTAMINLAKNTLLFDGMSIKTLNSEIKEIPSVEEISEELAKTDHSYPIKGKDKEKVKGGKKKEMSEEKTEETSEEKTEETITVSNELSDADVLSIISQDMDGFNAFKKENPSLSMKDLAVKFKERNERLGFVEKLSESEATLALRKLLDKIGVNELNKVPKELSQDNSITKELARQLENVQKELKEIKELKSAEKIPSPKTVQNLTALQDNGFSMVGKGTSEGVQELAQEIFGMRR